MKAESYTFREGDMDHIPGPIMKLFPETLCWFMTSPAGECKIIRTKIPGRDNFYLMTVSSIGRKPSPAEVDAVCAELSPDGVQFKPDLRIPPMPSINEHVVRLMGERA